MGTAAVFLGAAAPADGGARGSLPGAAACDWRAPEIAGTVVIFAPRYGAAHSHAQAA